EAARATACSCGRRLGRIPGWPNGQTALARSRAFECASANPRSAPQLRKIQGGYLMDKVQEYREHARRCEMLLAKADDPRVRQRLRQERQEWLELASSRE